MDPAAAGVGQDRGAGMVAAARECPVAVDAAAARDSLYRTWRETRGDQGLALASPDRLLHVVGPDRQIKMLERQDTVHPGTRRAPSAEFFDHAAHDVEVAIRPNPTSGLGETKKKLAS